MKTIEQQRAYFALKCVERVKILVEENKWFEFENGDFKKQIFLSSQNIDLSELKKWSQRGGVGEILWNNIDKELKNKFKGNKQILEDWKNFKENKSFPSQLLEEAYRQISVSFKKDLKKDYASHAKKLPQLIVSNGLVPTLAFYKSKGKERMQIYLDLELWLKYKNFIQGNHLLEYLLTSDANCLRVITVESLAFAEWLKRMAEVELREE